MPAELEFGAQPVVKVGGQALPSQLALTLVETIMQDHLHLPDMLELRFRDEEHEALKIGQLTVGKELELSASEVGSSAETHVLFKGEVTSLESHYEAASGTQTVVRAYDRSHRLMKHRTTRAWENTDLGELARTIAGDVGLSVGSLSNGTRYQYVAQMNETNWEFLHRLARESNHEVVTELGTLHLRKPKPADDAPREADVRQEPTPLQLVLGSNLRSLRTRVTAASQVPRTTVRAWDWTRKEHVVGGADAATETVQIKETPKTLASVFDASEALVCDRPFESVEQVDAAAAAVAERIASSSAEVLGTTDGNARLRAGTAVSISNTGEQFDGKFVVTSTRHVFDDGGYRTQFDITGRQERSVLGLTGEGGRERSDRIDGVVVGIVTNTRDPEDHGRVRLKFPWLAEDHESPWARVAAPDAGPDGRGMFLIPEVNDEVLVAFEHGDARRPYVIGRLWNGEDRAPVEGDDTSSGEIRRREWRSRLGHRLRFGDGPSASDIELRTADGKRSVHIDEKGGKILVTVDRTTVEITDSGNVTVDAANNVQVKAMGNMSLEATGTVEIKGAEVKVNGSARTEIKGGMITLN